jgi:hypothetical protein
VACPKNYGSQPALADVSAQSSRGHRRHGLLHSADRLASVALRLLIHWHDRRRILPFNMTRHPTSAWIVQQLREAFPYEPATSFSSSSMTPSMASKCPLRFARWTSSLCSRLLAVPGRYHTRNVHSRIASGGKGSVSESGGFANWTQTDPNMKSTEMATSLTGTDQVGNGS